MPSTLIAQHPAWSRQQQRNRQLLANSPYMRAEVHSQALPLAFDLNAKKLSAKQVVQLQALEIEAAKIAVRAVESLSRLNEVDHMGGGLDLIPALLLTLAVMDRDKRDYTIEHAHTSIGYYSALAVLGYLDPQIVIDGFRRGLDVPGHVSWVPGGTQANGGRLGVMIPVAVGQALGLRAMRGGGAWVICHCGDAGWISGQALNGFNGADLHNAPVTFVMHRNGIQLSGSNRKIMDKDPRPIIKSLGIEILEIVSLCDAQELWGAYRAAQQLALAGRPSLIYPAGYKTTRGKAAKKIDLNFLGRKYGIAAEVRAYAAKNGVKMETPVWIPGSLMSYRDVECMLDCLFLANELPGGKGHHDGHMKGRNSSEVLKNPMLQLSKEQQAALNELRKAPNLKVVTRARPAPGSPNLLLSPQQLAAVQLPAAGKSVSPRAGSEEGYAAIAKAHPDRMFIVSCDLDPSTKLGKAKTFLKPDHAFEMSIEEQVSALMADGLAISSREPQLNVFSTFAAFFEGIAREGLEMWRYQRNLNGSNEGLNVCMHLSHVGGCTGRDHFSGWSLDWITLAIGYLPYLHRFYAPADARAAFLAVKDLAAHYGGHIIGIPRDNLPVLARQDGSGALWEATSDWESVTPYREYPGARRAILAFGAPAFLAGEAAQTLSAAGLATDVQIVNGLPLENGALEELLERYPQGLVTVEDGIIGTPEYGLRGFAALVQSAGAGRLPLEHLGIVDPRIAPSEGHLEVWEHFGITAAALVEAVKNL